MSSVLDFKDHIEITLSVRLCMLACICPYVRIFVQLITSRQGAGFAKQYAIFLCEVNLKNVACWAKKIPADDI